MKKSKRERVVVRIEAAKQTHLLSAAVKQSSEGIAIVDLQGHVLFVNDAFAHMHGYESQELLGEHLSVLHAPEQMPAVEAANRRIEETGEFRGEVWHLRRDGTVFPTSMHNTLVRDDAGDPIAMLGTLRDISEREKAEQALRKAEAKYREVLSNIPGAVYQVAIKPDSSAHVELVSGDLSSLIGWTPEEVTSHNFDPWDVVVPEDTERLWAVIRTSAQAMQKSSIELRLKTKAGETRWISATAAPRLSDEGDLMMDGVVLDVTERKQAEEALRQAHEQLEARVQERTASLLQAKRQLEQEITERKRAEDALRESEERHRALFEQAADSIVVIDVETGLLLAFNDKAHENLGYTREEFKNLGVSDLEIIESPEEVALHLAKIAKEGADSFETKQRTKQGEIRDVHVRSKALSVGGRNLVQSIWYDITERKRGEETLKFLVRELDHRVKNTLATVESVAEHTLRSSASLADFGEVFQGRIRALARLHEAGAEKNWGPLPLRQLVELAVGSLSCDGGRMSIQGDPVVISPSSVRVIGMALHELATNAAKHGALSKAGGHVEISWQIESTSEGDWLRITWAESGGPPVAKPSRRSLGTILIEEAIAHELGGNVKLEFPVPGVQCEIRFPLPTAAKQPQCAAGQLAALGSAPVQTHERPVSLHGIKVIIVEDNLTLVQSLSFLLESYGCEVTGVAGTSDEALKLIAKTGFDVAILDIELGGTTVAPVANCIRQQGGRIVYLTGYGDLDMLPDELRVFPHLCKPVDSDLLLSTILDAVGHR